MIFFLEDLQNASEKFSKYFILFENTYFFNTGTAYIFQTMETYIIIKLF